MLSLVLPRVARAPMSAERPAIIVNAGLCVAVYSGAGYSLIGLRVEM